MIVMVMRKNCIIKLIPLLFFSFCWMTNGSDAGPEKAVNITDSQIAGIVAKALKNPINQKLDLKLELVDFIDCTDLKDLHPMMDQGTSTISSGPAGKYRVTAQGRNAFFSYRWKAAEQDVPHILVVEYPDDAKREVCFLTHESQMSGAANEDWSLETGVYTGNPLPVTNKMQYHTMFFWPQDKWPVIIIGNWNHQGAPAAASRIWVYRVVGDHLPAMKVKDADAANPRIIGDLYNWSLVPLPIFLGVPAVQLLFSILLSITNTWDVISFPGLLYPIIAGVSSAGSMPGEMEIKMMN